MGKLMKYEWKKQRTSRMIVMVALAVCVLTFFGGMLVEKDALMGISATLLLVGSFFVVFYMGIESILILNRDLKTKQSYMIWMTPKSVWEILGAKFVVAIAQMFFVFALYAIAGLLCFVGTIQYVGELGNVFAIIRDSFIRVSGEGQLIAQIIWNLLCIFVGWTEVVMVGYLAVIVSRTVLRDSKYAGGISIVAFFVITFVIEKIYNLISNVLPNVEVAGLVKRSELATAMNLLFQGMTFMQLGQEFMRTKLVATGPDGEITPLDRERAMNSYNAPDFVNQVNWDLVSQNKESIAYIRSLIALKTSLPVLGLESYDKIYQQVFIQSATDTSGLVIYELTGDKKYLVIFNASGLPYYLQNSNKLKLMVGNSRHKRPFYVENLTASVFEVLDEGKA